MAVHVHYGIKCDGCHQTPIVGERFRCVDCIDEFSVCERCHVKQLHDPQHRLFLISPPWDYEQVRRSMAVAARDFLQDDMLIRAQKDRVDVSQARKRKRILDSDEHVLSPQLKADIVIQFVQSHIQHLSNIINGTEESNYWAYNCEIDEE